MYFCTDKILSKDEAVGHFGYNKKFPCNYLALGWFAHRKISGPYLVIVKIILSTLCSS